MLVYGVPRDLPPHGLSFETMVLGNLAYAMSSFDAYVDTSRDYSTWFMKSSVGPIIGDRDREIRVGVIKRERN